MEPPHFLQYTNIVYHKRVAGSCQQKRIFFFVMRRRKLAFASSSIWLEAKLFWPFTKRPKQSRHKMTWRHTKQKWAKKERISCHIEVRFALLWFHEFFDFRKFFDIFAKFFSKTCWDIWYVLLPGIVGECRSGDRLDSYFEPFLANAVRALFWFLLVPPLPDGSSSKRN